MELLPICYFICCNQRILFLQNGFGQLISLCNNNYSIQFNADICTPQLINYRVGAHDKQNLNDKCSPGRIRKKVSFQFSFEAVQRKFRVAQMHWECVPGSRRGKVESSRTYRLGFRPGN